ncbi:MAG: EF-hand domain-containing protein [Novosphingobium sp.]|nr:EF-hand domain-containing protein [Novosphingobium sp.]
MQRFILGGVTAFVMLSVGLFWWQGRAEVEKAAPLPQAVAAAPDPQEMPSADLGDFAGPELPEATEQTREQRRFGRYDRDRDGRITRNEMLSTRVDAFRKLDKDGNNLLTFEEWAVATVTKFDNADTNHDQWLSPEEFRKTAPPPAKAKPRPKCSC